MANAKFTLSAEDRTKAAFDSVNKRMGQVRGALGALGRALTSLPAMIAGVAGAAGFGMLVRSAMQSGDEIAKLSDRLGIATEHLGGLQHAAELTGVGTGNLNRAIEGMNQRLGEAVNGTGEAVKHLDRMGLSARELAQMGPDEAIKRIADEVAGLGTQSEKTAAAVAIFGRQGKQLVNLLDEGSGGISAMQEEADRLGKTLTRVDAAQIEAANDAFTRLRTVVQGVAQRIAVALAPYLQAVSDYLVDAATEGVNFREVILGVMERASKAAGFLGNTVRGLQVAFKAVEVVARGFGAAVFSVLQLAMEGVALFIDTVNSGVNVAINALNRLPKVDIATIDPIGDSPFMTSVRAIGNDARDSVGVARGELHDLAMQEMPGDKIAAFFAGIAENAETAAQRVAQSRQRMGIGAANDDEDDAALDKQRDQLAQRFQQLEHSLLSEQERESIAHANRLLMLDEALENELLTEERHAELEQELYERHQGKLSEIAIKGMSERERFSAMSWRSQTAHVVGSLTQMTAAVSTQSRAMFNINKIAGVANAVINTAQAVTKALSAYPPPLSFAMASAQAAAGAVQISAIKSATFGSGTAPSVGATAAPPVTPITPEAGQGGGEVRIPEVRLVVEKRGSHWTDEEVEDLLQRQQELIRDGARAA